MIVAIAWLAMATHLLVGNPTAQSGKNQTRIDRAIDWLRRKGIPTEFLSTEPGGRTVDVVKNALDRGAFSTCIAMGGDGTFREVASGILASKRCQDVRLGMLPTGTANDQGRSFGLDAGDEPLERNLEIIALGHETRLDAGRLAQGEGAESRTAYFFDSAGWGLSARVLAERNRDRDQIDTHAPTLGAIYRDQMVYAGAFVKVFLESLVVADEFDAVVLADGIRHELTGLTDLVVKGTRVYGGAWVFDPLSKHDDGLFEVVPFRGKLDWASKAIVDLDGNPLDERTLNEIGVAHSRPFRGHSIHIAMTPASETPLAAQIDGEEFPACTSVAIEIETRALRLIVPGGST